ncbi:MAG TPA: hypothetical protein VMY39_02785 [Planctomycetota bacterium]|nr:hypothetical protein [Planctomycetota bacterium]
MKTSFATIADLHAAVLDLRADAEEAGVDVEIEHVRAAMTDLGFTRYEDVTRWTVGDIADRAVDIALAGGES